MIMFKLFLLSLFINLFNSSLTNTAWFLNDNGLQEIRIYSDRFYTITKFDLDNKKFISTSGGSYFFGENYYEVIEFNSQDTSQVGDTIFYSSFKLSNGDKDSKLIIENNLFEKYESENELTGSWLMSGIERQGEMRSRNVNQPRKTMKILAGGRFQWIAYDTSKKGFYGTGGGYYSTIDGTYTENIEFFSRDSNTVGNSLKFDYEIIEGDWHHKGFSSKGDPKYEIWTQRKK